MISGTVTDQSGASIPGAVVAARQRGKSAERKTTTDAAGSFQLSGVPAGAFDLEVTSQGFTTATIPVTVAGRSPAPLRVALNLAGVRHILSLFEVMKKRNLELSGDLRDDGSEPDQ